jgi:hypothetical protein
MRAFADTNTHYGTTNEYSEGWECIYVVGISSSPLGANA